MTEFSDYFEPVDIASLNGGEAYPRSTLSEIIDAYRERDFFPVLEEAHIAIIGVGEERRSFNNKGCMYAPDAVRRYLYGLYQGNYKARIVDLGNIKPGHNIEDTYFALKEVVNRLLRVQIVPVIIGGSHDLTFPQYLGYEEVHSTINIVSVDNSFNLGDADSVFDARSWLGKIILHQPNHLFNFSNIAYQTYLVDPKGIDLMAKLNFDTYRLGFVQKNLEEAEPIVRHADVLSFDMSAIRQSDASGNGNAGPNGLYGEEACQIMRYAGMSDKLSSVGIYEVNPGLDKRGHTAHLAAQMIWYFMEGFYSRKKDFPFKNIADYTKYRVSIKGHKSELVFYKSSISERWWMEVPYPGDKRLKYERHHLVPCSYRDYETACKEEMPDRWWQTYQKLS